MNALDSIAGAAIAQGLASGANAYRADRNEYEQMCRWMWRNTAWWQSLNVAQQLSATVGFQAGWASRKADQAQAPNERMTQ